ncbi:MAG TPA: hypothetical protein VHB20_09780 [Verrucomicrobiae bacterium]|nr:hypothetical protein [Verrucomicrobiae bacterium]
MLKQPIVVALVLGMEALTATSVYAAQTVTLAWNATPAAKGYMVYTSADGVNYQPPIDAGAGTSISLSGLRGGDTNFFYVTAYDDSFAQSAPSTPISYIVPGGMTMSAKVSAHAPAQMNFSVAPGHTYTVQASTDLKNWVTVLQTNAVQNQWITYQDPLAATVKMRFYRTLSD